MAKEFSLLGFISELGLLAIEIKAAEKEALEKGAKIIEDEAKRVIGTYDYGWPELAPATQSTRESLGYDPDEPLLREGTLRDSIEHTIVSDREAVIGSNEDVAVYQELGTATIPARSFLAGAASAKGKECAEILGETVISTVFGGTVIGKAVDTYIEGDVEGRVDVGARLNALSNSR